MSDFMNECGELKAEVAQGKSDLDQVRAAEETLKVKVAKLSRDRDESNAERDQYQGQLGKLQADVDALRRKLGEQQAAAEVAAEDKVAAERAAEKAIAAKAVAERAAEKATAEKMAVEEKAATVAASAIADATQSDDDDALPPLPDDDPVDEEPSVDALAAQEALTEVKRLKEAHDFAVQEALADTERLKEARRAAELELRESIKKLEEGLKESQRASDESRLELSKTANYLETEKAEHSKTQEALKASQDETKTALLELERLRLQLNAQTVAQGKLEDQVVEQTAAHNKTQVALKQSKYDTKHSLAENTRLRTQLSILTEADSRLAEQTRGADTAREALKASEVELEEHKCEVAQATEALLASQEETKQAIAESKTLKGKVEELTETIAAGPAAGLAAAAAAHMADLGPKPETAAEDVPASSDLAEALAKSKEAARTALEENQLLQKRIAVLSVAQKAGSAVEGSIYTSLGGAGEVFAPDAEEVARTSKALLDRARELLAAPDVPDFSGLKSILLADFGYDAFKENRVEVQNMVSARRKVEAATKRASQAARQSVRRANGAPPAARAAAARVAAAAAAAADSNPFAAANEQLPGAEAVVMTREPGEKWGCSFKAEDDAPGTYISKVSNDSVSARFPELAVGSRVLRINGQDAADASIRQVIDMVRGAGNQLMLEIALPTDATLASRKAAVARTIAAGSPKLPPRRESLSQRQRSSVAASALRPPADYPIGGGDPVPPPRRGSMAAEIRPQNGPPPRAESSATEQTQPAAKGSPVAPVRTASLRVSRGGGLSSRRRNKGAGVVSSGEGRATTAPTGDADYAAATGIHPVKDWAKPTGAASEANKKKKGVGFATPVGDEQPQDAEHISIVKENKFGRHKSVKWFKDNEQNKGVGQTEGSAWTWFHGVISRRRSEALLMPVAEWSFLIRVSESRFGYVLSVRGDTRAKPIHHYMIEQNSSGKYGLLAWAGDGIRYMRDPLCDTLEVLVRYFSKTPMHADCDVLGTPVGHSVGNDDLTELFGELEALKQDFKKASVRR